MTGNIINAYERTDEAGGQSVSNENEKKVDGERRQEDVQKNYSQ